MTKKKSFGCAVEFKSNPKFEKERESRHKEGLKLIEKWLKRYPKTKYPTVDDDLILLFIQGARLLDLNYMILPEDDMECPKCHYKHGKIGKGALSLHTSYGNNTTCLYCSCEMEYKSIMKHNLADCDCPKEQYNENGKLQWSRKDCLLMYKGFES